MTREEFIQILDNEGDSYVIEGDKIVVTEDGNVFLTSIPPGVEFKNGGSVYLQSLETLPPGVEFNNGGTVYLDLLKTIPPGVVFKNGGGVYLRSLTGDWFNDWDSNINGIDSKTLLNGMIKRGIFH